VNTACGGPPPRHQRGHSPQRGLLLGQLTLPCMIGRITAYSSIGGIARTGASVWRVHMTDASPALGRRQCLRRSCGQASRPY
jgi:hypothetical protein